MKIKKSVLRCITVLLILLTIINSNFSTFEIMAKETATISSKESVIGKDNTQTSQYHYQDEEVEVLVTLNDPSDLPENAHLKVSPIVIDETMNKVVNESIATKKMKVENKTAYDISFSVNGVEIQPNNRVKVEINLIKDKTGLNSSVFHYDDKVKTVKDMGAKMTPQKTVEFNTTHFSTYVVVNTSNNAVNVSIEHYNEPYVLKETRDVVFPPNNKNGGLLDGGKTTIIEKNIPSAMIYKSDTYKLEPGSKLINYAKAVNWDVKKIVEVIKLADGKEKESIVANINELGITEDKAYRIYYTPKTDKDIGDVKFYDYTVMPTLSQIKNGINTASNYKTWTSGKINNNKLAISADSNIVGKVTQSNQNINLYTGLVLPGDNNTSGKAYKGIVSGLTPNYADVIFDKGKIDDPNVFNEKEIPGKFIFNDFKLQFSQLGDTYTLETVNRSGKTVAQAGTNFFPLDSIAPKEEGCTATQIQGCDIKNTATSLDTVNKHNSFFGMRYDVNFTIGDYVGALNYTFSGDDDLWVILDGEKIVIDLGGIHNCLTESVDLWKYIKDANGNYDKNKEHTLTILYMERGANDSNCRMSFTLPNASIAEVIKQPSADLTIKKVNSNNQPLSGAEFRLINDATNNVITTTSDEKGNINLKNLKIGSYKLVETKAPSGYIAAEETWVVKVASIAETNQTIAALYKADGTTKIDNKTIINNTPSEIIDKTISYNKTASLRNWDTRTYDINLEATAKDATKVTPVPYDVVMVLDRSGSMTSSFVQYEEFTGTEFSNNSKYYYKTQYGIYQMLDVDVNRSKTSAIFIDTDNGNNKVEVKLGVNTIYTIANYLKFDGDKFKGIYYPLPDGSKYFAATESYYYKQDDGSHSAVRVLDETKAYTTVGGKNVDIDLMNSKVKERLYVDTDSMSKMTALANAATEFIENVTKLSPNSRISIVDYSTGDKILVHKNSDNKTMIRVGDDGNLETMKSWLENHGEVGNTRSDLGLNAAYEVFKDESSWEAVEEDPSIERKKMVVFFTDGVTTDDYGSYSPVNAKKAVAIADKIRSDFQASIYAVGIFDTANKKGSLQALEENQVTAVTVKSINDTMSGIANPDSYFNADSASSLKDLFIKISTDVVQLITADMITDVIDNRFELTAESEALLKTNGAKITKNADGTTTITWENQAIKRKIDDHPGWLRTFTVIAKNDYIGGNNIRTNGEDSYIKIKGVIAPFPLPVVNVKTDLKINDLDKTIFLGEGIPNDTDIFKDIQNIINTNVTKYRVPKNAFVLTWTDDATGKVQTGNWNDIKPTKDANYSATLIYSAGSPSAESNKNTTKNDITYYSGDIKNAYKNILKGTYRIHVVKGQMEIKKVIDQQYTNAKMINANQTFVFKIERYDVDENNKKKGDKPIEVYHETINFDANDTIDNKTKIISGLKKGYYTVSEETTWSSKYKLTSITDNYTKNSSESVDLFIGDQLEEANGTLTTKFYGLEQDQTYLKYARGERASSIFNNNIKKDWIWLSDSSAAVNVFNK